MTNAACLAVVSIVLVCGCRPTPSLDEIKQKVAEDMVSQFTMVTVRHMDAVEAGRESDLKQLEVELCVKAGGVAEAYLQAHDNAHYNQWNEIETGWCKTAGLRQ